MRRVLVFLALSACSAAPAALPAASTTTAPPVTTTSTSGAPMPSAGALERYRAGARDLEALETCLQAYINRLDVDTSWCRP